MDPNSIQDQQNLIFNSFTSDFFLGDSDLFDSDVLFLVQHPKNKQTKYFAVGNTTVKVNSPKKDVFSFLYLNTRDMNKNFESLKTLLSEFGF